MRCDRFNCIALVTAALTSAGGTDVFVARYDEDGSAVWVKGAGGVENDRVYSVAASAGGHIAVTGAFGGTELFEPREPDGWVMMSKRESDFFVAQYFADGTPAWTRRVRVRSQGDPESGVAVLPDRTVVAAGSFLNSADFDPDGPRSSTLNSAAGNGIFVAKYSGGLADRGALESDDPPPHHGPRETRE